jgi:hypothetical protein
MNSEPTLLALLRDAAELSLRPVSLNKGQSLHLESPCTARTVVVWEDGRDDLPTYPIS